MAASVTGVDHAASVRAAEAMAEDFEEDIGVVADLLTEELLSGAGLVEAVANLRPHPGALTLSSDVRDRLASARDAASDERDLVADLRDAYADSRIVRAELLESVPGRYEAQQDRDAAAADRASAAADRVAALGDRVASAADRLSSSVDGLTGAYRRDAGTWELERETARAHRTGDVFVLAFVDVDGLKHINDTEGHGAGDRLLRRVVETMQAQLRTYDLIVRVGGDEFVCGLPDVPMEDAEARFAAISAALAESEHAAITVGLVQLRTDETLQDLVRRGDDQLYRRRRESVAAIV